MTRANGPESYTMHRLRPVRQVAAQGAKSAVPDCILLVLVAKTYQQFGNAALSFQIFKVGF